jgi:hypothetical protein
LTCWIHIKWYASVIRNPDEDQNNSWCRKTMIHAYKLASHLSQFNLLHQNICNMKGNWAMPYCHILCHSEFNSTIRTKQMFLIKTHNRFLRGNVSCLVKFRISTKEEHTEQNSDKWEGGLPRFCKWAMFRALSQEKYEFKEYMHPENN